MNQDLDNSTARLNLSASDLPPALRVFWENAPQRFKAASLLAATACYCSLGTRLRGYYVYDTEPHALLLQIIVLGPPGSGKSFTRPIVNQLMAPLKEKDQEQQDIERAYAERKKTKGANEKLPEEPITVKRIINTITKAKLVKRADMMVRKYGEPLAFFFFSEELATMTESNKRAYADLNTMDRLAYDLGAEFSTDTLSDASYNADVDIIYTSLFCGTDNALDEYITKRSVEGGNCTRKVLVRIDDNSKGAKAPVFIPQTPEQQQLIKDILKQLMAETYGPEDTLQPVHLVPMEWTNQTVERWCNRQRSLVRKTNNDALDCFYKRSSVSAWRMTLLNYHLWCLSEHLPEDSDPDSLHKIQWHCLRFYRSMANFILKGLMDRWGLEYELLQKPTEGTSKSSLYNLLPKEFTREQVQDAAQLSGLKSPVRVFIDKWLKQNLIYQPDKDVNHYVKNY